MRKKLFSNILEVPKWVYIITLICFIAPFLIEEFYIAKNLRQMEFFFLLIPTFFWSYYLGLIGGITGALLSNLILIGNTWYEHNTGVVHQIHERYVVYVIIIINFIISIGIGYLADRLIKQRNNLKLLAATDSLTLLHNRRYILDKLKTVNVRNKAAAIYIDLDRFKYINDSLGHGIGDKLLEEVGIRLTKIVNKETIARIGGDEFVILLSEEVELDFINKLPNRIKQDIAKPYKIKELNIFVTVSIGISIYPDNTNTIEQLINNADIAMFQAKKLGKNQVQMYKEEMKQNFLEKAQLEQEIYRAIDNKEFLLYYQPKFNLEKKEIIGVEALIRWQHPSKGLVSPVKFIPIAEQSNMIFPIGEWVIETVCLQIKEWQDKGLTPLRVAVNVSAHQFNPCLVEFIKKTLEATNIKPQLLEIEITEGTFMQNLDESIQVLEQLNKLGIFISIDDFGTGYSSLSYLNKLPVHCLKIDKSFVHNCFDEKSIIETIVMLGQNLNFDVIAEGIETEGQLDYLRKLRCNFGQGYLLSKPITAKEFEQKFLKSSVKWKNYLLS